MENTTKTPSVVALFVNNLVGSTADGSTVFKKSELQSSAKEFGLPPVLVKRYLFANRVSHGYYDISDYVSESVDSAPVAPAPVATAPVQQEPVLNLASTVHHESEEICEVPSKDSLFVKWGHFKSVKTILDSESFFPVYIAGPSGNGKTFMVEQACAHSGRKFIRVQISPETDEDDLIGGFRLVNGNTVFSYGPVIRAMREGAVLLLDEIDRGTNKIMCLQSVLEGKSVLLKKTGEVISPAPGFQVIATANTTGRGSFDGKYSAASIIDEAFLERFPITISQPWATKASETRILERHADKYDVNDSDFVEKLITWASVIRSAFDDGAVEDFISTRRLCHAIQTFSMFNDRSTTIELITSRFDEESREAFSDLYNKIDAGEITHPEDQKVTQEQVDQLDDDPGF